MPLYANAMLYRAVDSIIVKAGKSDENGRFEKRLKYRCDFCSFAKLYYNGMIVKALHIALALNILLSSSGVTVFEHLCRMKGRTASFFFQAGSCCKKQKTIKSPGYKTKCCSKKEASRGASIHKKPCCEDRAQFFKTDTEGTAVQKKSLPDAKFHLLFADAFSNTQHLGVLSIHQKNLRFYLYKPPLIASDIRVLVQSFLC